MFDFANSSYTTIIVTVVYSVFFTKVIVGGGPHAEFMWSIGLFTSELLVVCLAPVIGAIADYAGAKKRCLFISYLVCVAGTALLWFVRPGWVVLGLVGIIVSNLAYSLGDNLNSSFLPELAEPKTMGRVSGFAWAVGYLGGLVSLAACIPFVKGGITLENEASVRVTTLVTAGLFFVGGIPAFLLLKERAVGAVPLSGLGAYVRKGVERVISTLRHVGQYPRLAEFFPVYFLYMAGLSIVIAFSAIFAEKSLGFESKDLMMLFLGLQISAFLGALAFGFLQDRIGPRQTILVTLLMWMGVVVTASVCQSKELFFIVANVAGLSIGATASASRTYVGLLVPLERTAEMYGFMGLFSKLASGLGALSFGIGVSVLGGQRPAMMVPLVFFALGFLGLKRLKTS